MNDFNLIPVPELVILESAAWHEFFVDLDGDSLASQAQLFEERGQLSLILHFSVGSVDDDIHDEAILMLNRV